MPKPIKDAKDLRELALFYCSKQETSRAKLEQYLARKCQAQEIDQPEWIETILDEFVKLNIIDDARYGGIIVRGLKYQGKGKHFIDHKLVERGIPEENFKFETTPEAEEARALETAKKFWERISLQNVKLPTNLKPGTNSENLVRKQKLMQKLAAAGFSFELVKRVADKLVRVDESFE